MTQYCFVDDSGDPGLGNVQASSTHFALVLVQLSKREPLVELGNIRRMLYLSPNFEFKYHKAKPHQKALFFEAIRPIPFRVYAVVVHKAGLEKQFSAMSGQEFIIEFISGLVLRTSVLDIANNVLVIDGATPAFIRSLRIRLSEACRQLKRVRLFQKIVGGDSSGEDGLQLADMLAGAIRHYVMGIDRIYYQTFASKVVSAAPRSIKHSQLSSDEEDSLWWLPCSWERVNQTHWFIDNVYYTAKSQICQSTEIF